MPGAKLPTNPQERTAFRVPAETGRAVDLTLPPFDQDSAAWGHPTNYGPCQDFADAARTAGIEAIRQRPVRDPGGGANLALLSPAAFRVTKPELFETWTPLLRDGAVQVVREMPRLTLGIYFSAWASDPHVPGRLSL